MNMKKIFKILKYWSKYKSWKQIKKGKKPINLKRGVGYYFTTGLIMYNPKKEIHEIEMESKRTAIAHLIDYKLFRDPDDMIKESFWHISGYKGEKLFKDMTFKEYILSAFGITIDE